MSAQSLPLAIPEQLASSRSFELGYCPSLDGVRGMAILSVLAVHTNHLFGWSLLRGGSLGVDIFFVLSGFLITCLLLEEWTRTGDISLRHFYWRRFWRLVPAFLLVTGVLLVLSDVAFSAAEATSTRRAIPVALLYLTDFLASFSPATSLGALRHTWSLAIEEHFYLLWPPILLLLLKSDLSKRNLLILTGSLALAVSSHRAFLFASGLSPARTYYAFDTRADALLIGCATGMAVTWGLVQSRNLFTILAVALMALCVIGTDFASPVMHEGGFTIFAAATALLLINLVLDTRGVFKSCLELRPLVWVGKISYGVYLWHYPVFKAVSYLNTAWPFKLAVALSGTFAIASASFYVIEKPLLRLKQRFIRVGTNSDVVAARN